MADSTSIMSGHFARSGNATLSDRYNSKTYAIRGKEASKIANGRDDVKLMSSAGRSRNTDALIDEDALTGRSDWDLLVTWETPYRAKANKRVRKGYRLSPTINQDAEQKVEKDRSTPRERAWAMSSLNVEV